MKINFNFPVTDLDGSLFNEREDFKKANLTINKLIARNLVNDAFKESDPIKKNILAKKIYNGGEMEIDKGDFGLIKKSIEFGGSTLTNVVKGEILAEMSKIEAQNQQQTKKA